VKLDASDIADLEPVIALTVRKVLDAIEAAQRRLGSDRLAYPEKEAAALCGVQGYVLRDARRRGEIEGRLLGKKIVYARSELLRFLADGGLR
jgi:hypothetical protein